MAADAFHWQDTIEDLQQAEHEIRSVLDEMAVVPSAHRARLMVALRLLEQSRARLKELGGGR